MWILAATAWAIEWHDDGRASRIQIEFDGSAAGVPAPIDLNALLALNIGQPASWTMYGEDGSRVAFEVEGALSAEPKLWLTVPAAVNGVANVYLYADPDGTAAPGGPDAAAAWSSDYLGVWHFDSWNEATGRAPTNWAGGLPQVVTGAVGPSLQFNGQQHLVVSNEPSFDLQSTMTISVWVRPDSTWQPFAAVVSKGETAWGVERDEVSEVVELDNTGGANGTGCSVPIGVWTHMHFVKNGGDERAYMDGVQCGSSTGVGNATLGDFPLWIANNPQEPTRRWHGELDELRITSVVRSNAWVTADHDAQVGTGPVLGALCVQGSTDADGDGFTCDLDCDDGNDAVSEFTWYDDADGDGFGVTPTTGCYVPTNVATVGGDCDDHDATVNPGATEECNSVDDNCDGTTDEGLPTQTWFEDLDFDGFGGNSIVGCQPPPNALFVGEDCDDSDPDVNPGAAEVCNGADDDCNGQDDDGLELFDWYVDGDGDEYGTGTPVAACAAPAGTVALGNDCNDTDSSVNPAADEICDNIDNDCDGAIDDADDEVVGAPIWYQDSDGDLYGASDLVVYACLQPAGTTAQDGDCDDDQPNVYPTAPEACIDGLDNDCDDLVDSADPDYTDAGVPYGNDADDDGYADPTTAVISCSGSQPLGYVPLAAGDDCNDAEPLMNPGRTEECDGLDNNCSGIADEGLTFLDYYQDADSDGYGDPNSTAVNTCEPTPGLVSNALDCDDNDADRNPDAIELCNGIDDDCDTLLDEGLNTQDYWPDADEDGYGDQDAYPEPSCTPLDGYVQEATDCDDTDSSIYPGAPEDPEDGIDSDCDGTLEEPPPEPLRDADGDGVPDTIDGNPDIAGSGETVTPPLPNYGCGCQTSSPSGGVLLALGLLWSRRR